MPSLMSTFFAGDTPEVPDYTKLDLADVMRQTTDANTGSITGEKKLAKQTNQINFNLLDDLLAKSIPGYHDLKKGQSDKLSSYLNGEIPQDVADAIQRSGAAQSIAGGFGGSGMHGNLVARDLGRTSDDYVRYAMSEIPKWMQSTKNLAVPQQYMVGQNFLNSQNVAALRRQEGDQEWNRNWLKSQVDAAPAPWERALTAALDSIADTGLSILSSYAGGAMGGGGGGGGGGYSSPTGTSFGFQRGNL